MPIRIAKRKYRNIILEKTNDYLESLINADYDHIYEDLITEESFDLLNSMAWPLIYQRSNKIDKLFLNIGEDNDVPLIDALSLAFHADRENCRSGLFQGMAERVIEHQWHEFDRENAIIFVEDKGAILASDVPGSPFFMLFKECKGDYLIDFEALWLFSENLTTSSVLDIADYALGLKMNSFAIEFYKIAAGFFKPYLRIDQLMCKHPLVRKFITIQRKQKMSEEATLTSTAKERIKMLSDKESVIKPMELDEYEKALRIISDMAIAMERSPGAFLGLKEEYIRDIFLVSLNGHYNGNATGETFNSEGKADIILRKDNVNLFVAECKFWHSPSHFMRAVDQLLQRYATWRDTRLVLLIFNREGVFSEVISKVHNLIRNHSSYHQDLEYSSDTGLRCLVRHKRDKDRYLILTILLFDVPK